LTYLRAPLAIAVLAAFACGLRVLAAEPPSVTYDRPAPGTVQQNVLLYLAGDGMNSQWRAVLSRKQVGSNGTDTFYQWYLSVYAIDGTTYKLKYRSPGDGGPFSNVTKANGAQMWFPIQTGKIDPPAELTMPAKDALIVESHEMSADCGAGVVAVFTTDAAGKVVPAVSARNGCELTAKPVSSKSGPALQLNGPYYAANAAMCCPTKPKASSTLQYVAGKWTQTPSYYEIFPGKLPPT